MYAFEIFWNLTMKFAGEISLSRHSVKIKPLGIYHSFCEEVFLLSFEKKSSFINNSLLHKSCWVFISKLLFWKIFLIFKIMRSRFIALVFSSLWVFVSNIDLKGCLFVFCKLTSSGLFFYDVWLQSVTICHDSMSQNII